MDLLRQDAFKTVVRQNRCIELKFPTFLNESTMLSVAFVYAERAEETMRRVSEQYASAVLMLLTFGLLWGATRGAVLANYGDFDDEKEVAWAGWLAPNVPSPRRPAKEQGLQSTGGRFLGVEFLEISSIHSIFLPFSKSAKDFLNLLRISRK
jgi:hypothetical protein